MNVYVECERYLSKEPLSFVYFHGKLEDKMGYDISNCDECDYETIFANTTGIFNVVCYDKNGRKHKGKMYVWKHGRNNEEHHGLIVDPDDKPSVKYAVMKMKERSPRL